MMSETFLQINFQVYPYLKDACVLLATCNSTHLCLPELAMEFGLFFFSNNEPFAKYLLYTGSVCVRDLEPIIKKVTVTRGNTNT